jgi:hypothetical protein
MKTLAIIIFNFIAFSLYSQINAGQYPQTISPSLQASVSYPTLNPTKFTDSVDVDNDGTCDFIFGIGSICFDCEKIETFPNILNSKIQISTDSKGIKKYNIGDLISSSGNWMSLYSPYIGDPGIYFRGMYRNTYGGPPYLPYTYSGNWADYIIDGSSVKWPDYGYLGFRINNTQDTLYGWMNIYSMTDINCCLSISCNQMGLESPSQIKQNNKKSIFSVFPNPIKNKITIEILPIEKESILIICNINGQELIRQNLTQTETQLDINNLTSGIYFVKLITDKTVEVRKIIKE